MIGIVIGIGNPPEHAIVLCADEKSQIQALDRTQPGLPIKKGRCGTMTHDYKRNGTATFDALPLMPRDSHGEAHAQLLVNEVRVAMYLEARRSHSRRIGQA